MKCIRLVSLFLFMCSFASGQTPFISVLNSASNYPIWSPAAPVSTPDGGYMTASSLNRDPDASIINYKIVLSKLDSSGQLEWSKSYEAPEAMTTQQLIADATGYLLAVGFDMLNWPYLMLMRFDQNGDTLWTRRYPQMTSSAGLYLRQDGNYISLGHGNYFGSSVPSQVRCIDTTGNVLWMHSYTNFPDAGSGGLPQWITCSDGGYLIFDQATVVAKMDSAGNYLWSTPRYYYNNQSILANGLAEFSDGSYLLVGQLTYLQTASAFMMKISASGNIVWFKTITGGSWLTYFSRAKTFSNGLMQIRGYVKPGYFSGACDWMVSIDTAGNILSSQKVCDINGYGYWGVDFNESPFGGMMSTGYRFNVAQTNNFSYVVASHGMTPAGCNISAGPSTVTTLQLANPQAVTFINANIPLTAGTDSALTITQNVYSQGNYCTPTGLEHPIETGQLQLYPNPCSDKLFLELPSWNEHTMLEITDISGKVKITAQVDHSIKPIDITSLAPGMYLLRITGNRIHTVQKFFKK